MGWLKFQHKHIELAKDSACLNRNLDDLDTPAKMLAYYESEARRRGIRIIPKSSLFGADWARMTTTFRWNIRVGTNYAKYNITDKALNLAHEFVHVRQWDKYFAFGPRYLGARFGWSMEMQAYRESMRALKVLGADREFRTMYADARAGILWDSYKLMRQIRHKEIRKHTGAILRDEL